MKKCGAIYVDNTGKDVMRAFGDKGRQGGLPDPPYPCETKTKTCDLRSSINTLQPTSHSVICVLLCRAENLQLSSVRVCEANSRESLDPILRSSPRVHVWKLLFEIAG